MTKKFIVDQSVAMKLYNIATKLANVYQHCQNSDNLTVHLKIDTVSENPDCGYHKFTILPLISC